MSNLTFIQKIASRQRKTVCKDRWMGPFLKNGGWGYSGGRVLEKRQGVPHLSSMRMKYILPIHHTL